MARKYKHAPKYTCSWHLQYWSTPSTSNRNPSQSRGNNEEDRGGGTTGTGMEVTRVVTNLTVGPDACRGWDIYIGRGGAGSQEAPTYHGGKAPQRNSCVLHHWRSPKGNGWGQLLFVRSASSKTTQSSLFGNCPSLASPLDSPWSG